MKQFRYVMAVVALLFLMTVSLHAQNNPAAVLSQRHHHIVAISSLTAKGDLPNLQKALSNGLEAGLTINEIKEVIVHLSAYAGFPRSLQGLNTFIAVLDARKAEGKTDIMGREPTAIKNTSSKYQQGKKALETLTGQPEREPKTGYAAFAPVIDTFLKEHLFADIFSRDVLNYTDREIATVAALVSLGGVEPMMRGHMGITMRLGITESQMRHLLSLIEASIGREEADAGHRVLSAITNSTAAQNSTDTTVKRSNIFAKGMQAPNTNFTGTVWVNMLLAPQAGVDVSVGSVTFEPGARSNWHKHPGGQILLVTEGKGYYQERGQPIRIMQKGDVLQCLPGVEHWHGASHDSKVTHIAVGPNAQKGGAVWLQKVTDQEYAAGKQ